MSRTVATTAAAYQEGTLKYPGNGGAGATDSRYERTACPLYTAIGVIEGRWKPMLFQRLARRPLSPIHRGVRYELTPYGRTLGPVFQALWQWGTTHLRRRDAAMGTMVKPPRSSPTP